MVVKNNFDFGGVLLTVCSVLILSLSLYQQFAYTNIAFTMSMRHLALSLFMMSAIVNCRPLVKYKLLHTTVLVLSIINLFVILIMQYTLPYHIIHIYDIITTILLGGAMLVFCVVDFWRYRQGLRVSISLVSLMILLCTLTVAFQPISTMQACAWLSSCILILSLVIISSEFVSIERRNKILTNNLKAEVNAQTISLKNTIADKDKLLGFITHDLRKPVGTISRLLASIDHNLLDQQGKQSLADIDTKINHMNEAFYNISHYSKNSTFVEDFSYFNLHEFRAKIVHNIAPDCSANGIEIAMNIKKNITVYAKRATLVSVIENLILNAIEHAHCNIVSITASKYNDAIQMHIADNDKGIDNANDIFSPYVTTSNLDNNQGLGLYIAKSQIESMGGKISYMTDHGSIFTITLLSSHIY